MATCYTSQLNVGLDSRLELSPTAAGLKVGLEVQLALMIELRKQSCTYDRAWKMVHPSADEASSALLDLHVRPERLDKSLDSCRSGG